MIHRTQHPDPPSLCCDAMRAALQLDCDTHDDPFDCPDCLVAFHEAQNLFGLIVHDGARDVVVIRHCPWCGAPLGSGVHPQGS